MKRLRSVCLPVLAMVLFSAVRDRAQTPAPTKGISVEMAVTTSAASLPDADNPDAWILTVTRGGTLFFGTLPGKPEELLGEMKARPRKRSQEIYIKADARASFEGVQHALDLARKALFRRAYLLTSQPTQTQPGTLVPPKGLEVWIGPESTAGAVPVELLSSGQTLPTLKVAGQPVERSALKTTLAHLWEEPSGKEVVVKADAKVDFEDVVHVIDGCRSFDAKVILSRTD